MNISPDQLPKPEDDSDKKLLADIRDVGWHVVLIEEDTSGHAWAFLVGLFHSFDHPEIIIFGCRHEVMHQMINIIGYEVHDGVRFADETRSPCVHEKYDCLFRAVHQRWYPWLLGTAMWFYRDRAFPVLQCVWPDRAGKFPGDPCCNKSAKESQPLLWLESEAESGMTCWLETMRESDEG